MKTSSSLNELFSSVMSRAEMSANRQLALISAAIELWRVENNMTQKEFAKFMGVTQSMVSKWESGEYNFSVKILSEISDRMGISLESLFCGNPPLREYSKRSMASTQTQLCQSTTTSVAPVFEDTNKPNFPFEIISGGAA